MPMDPGHLRVQFFNCVPQGAQNGNADALSHCGWPESTPCVVTSALPHHSVKRCMQLNEPTDTLVSLWKPAHAPSSDLKAMAAVDNPSSAIDSCGLSFN